MLSGIRAFEADLRADVESPEVVLAHTDEYVERLVDNIHEIKDLVSVVTRRGGAADG